MEPYQLAFEYEESPASQEAIALYITVGFQGVTMKHILDVEKFYNSLKEPGIHPLFTCSCGNFGCGGYYVEVIHCDAGLNFKNSYNPLEQPSPSSILAHFEYTLSWQDALLMGRQIQVVLQEICSKWPGYSIFSGTYCSLDLAGKLTVYEEILAGLEAKL